MTETKSGLEILHTLLQKSVLYLAVFLDIYIRMVMGRNINECLVMHLCKLIVENVRKKVLSFIRIRDISLPLVTFKHYCMYIKQYQVLAEKDIIMHFMESFYKTTKRELVQDAHFETPEQAQ